MNQSSHYSGPSLRIAIVCDAVTDCVAGSFVSTLRFAERLKERGHHVIFITSRSPRNPHSNEYRGITAYRFRSLLLPKSEGQLYISFPSSKEIREILLKEHVDIVHVIIPTPAAAVAFHVAKKLGIKTVAHSHTQPENLTMHIPISVIRTPIDRLFYRYLSWLYGKADALIYPTIFAERLLTRTGVHQRTLIISNGVDTKKFTTVNTADFEKKFTIDRTKINILYVGRLHPEKSVDTLINAIPKLVSLHHDVQVLIAGFGHLEKSLVALSERLGVGTHVSFLGRVSDEELVAAYNVCDIFVLPSLAELEGMVVLEAMSCGKPVVIADSKESASPYFVHENGLLFKPENAIDLAIKLHALITDEGLRIRMGEESLKLSAHYDINESVRRLEELYYSLLHHNE